MSRNLDPTLAGALSAGLIQPAFLVQLTLNSGIEYVWSGVGDLVWNGKTFSGVGNLGSIGPIGEGSAVKADGTSVTLSGIGLSQLDVPNPPVTPPDPPFTPPAGQSVAWAFATVPPTPGTFSNPPSVWNLFLGCSGEASGNLFSGSIAMTNGQPLFGINRIGLVWSGFKLPPEIPAGAMIRAVYPVVVVSSHTTNCNLIFNGINHSPSSGENVGTDAGTIAGLIEAEIANSVEGAASLSMGISFVGMAVYYDGVPLTKTTLLYEALQDIRMGAPAKIWYGLMSSGSFLGTPYLIFSGTVDKPTVKTSVDTNSITIALENRLVNLQRPNARRYTAADQHLYFPTDSAFNFVEILNDMALVWG